MGIIEWATSPLGQNVPIHIAWFLIWVALIAGLLFLVVHAVYLRYFAKEKEFVSDASPQIASQLPARIPRHSLTARLFHWIMAAAMFTLLFTAFLPKVGVQFDWVTYHWIAGTVLTISIIFHIIHATFYWISGRYGRTGPTLRTPGKESTASWESRLPRPGSSPNTRWRTSSTMASS